MDSVSRIRELPAILKNYTSENLLIVISAMGKTNNALEKVAEAFCGIPQLHLIDLTYN